jgi:nitroreductase
MPTEQEIQQLKTPPLGHDTHPLISQRWSPRAFSDKPVDAGTLESLFNAARWAASSMNEQPWRFLVGLKGDATWQKIYDSLVDANKG